MANSGCRFISPWFRSYSRLLLEVVGRTARTFFDPDPHRAIVGRDPPHVTPRHMSLQSRVVTSKSMYSDFRDGLKGGP